MNGSRKDPFKVGDMVMCSTGRCPEMLCRVEAIDGEHCWLRNQDGDTFRVPLNHPDLQDAYWRWLSESIRDTFYG